MTNTKKMHEVIRILIWLVSSFCFLFLFSYSTSPFYSNCWGHDSAVFQIVGRGWEAGYVPYKNAFDHKGPLLFFLNGIGYIFGGRSGVFALQILFMTVFLEVSYRTCKIFLGNRISFMIPFIELIILCRTFDEGNMTEEWSLFFIAISFYYIVKWIKSYEEGGKEHSPFFAFIYGLSFSCILFLRVSNAIGIVCSVFIITCFLVKEKKWRNLAHNIIAIIAGVLLGILPFSIYFAIKGSLYDMWYATILFNLSYGMESLWDMKMKISLILWALAALSVVYWWFNKRKPASYIGIVSSVFTGCLLYGSRGYEHYYMILCTYAVLYIYMVIDLWKKKKRIWGSIFIFGLLMQMGVTIIFLPNKINRKERIYNDILLNNSFDSIMNKIPVNEKNQIIFYNMEAQAYLYAGIQPCLKYFTHQDFHSSISAETQQDVKEQFIEHRPKWIIVEIIDEIPVIENRDVKKFLLDNYELKGYEKNDNRNEKYGIYKYKK